jgi:pentatricopeptide repeat protein
MDGIGEGIRVVQATSLGMLVDLPEPPVIDFDNHRVHQNVKEKEAVTIKTEEEVEDEPRQAESSSSSSSASSSKPRKMKKPWNGPIWSKKSPSRPSYTEEECAQRVSSMLYELEEDGVTGPWAVGNVLDSWVGKVTRVDLSKVIKELGARRNSPLALEVFQWMQAQKGRLKPNKHTYSLILGVLGRGGMITEARELFDAMLLSPNVEVCVYSYNAMIGAYARSGNFKKAWRLYESMIEQGVQADEITLSILLNGVGKADLPVEKAEMIFSRIKENGILPSVQTYNTLMSVLRKRGHAARCSELHKEMQMLEVVPDIYTFNTLLMMHVDSGSVNEAMEVYERMKYAGLQPTVVTYTGLIQMFSRGSKHKEAIELFLEMQRVGCKPDLTTYSLMITVYGKAGSAEESALVFRQLQQAGLRPSVVTWSSLIQVFGWHGRLHEVGAYFNEMLASGCQPDLTLYNVVMGAYGRHGHSVQAAILFRRMQAQGLNPSAVSYDTMIQAYCHAKQPADAHAVLDQMTKAGFTPDRISRAMLQQQLGVQYAGGSHVSLSRKERRRLVRRQVSSIHCHVK